MPASDLETLVEDLIRAILMEPAAILEFAGSTTVAARKTLIERAADFVRRWPELSASERRGHLGACVSRVEVGADTVEITIHPLQVLAAIRGSQNPVRPDEADKGPTSVLTVPARIKRTGLANKLVIGGKTNTATKPDRSLLRLIAQARQLHDLAMIGNGKPIHELAAEVGLSRSYFTRVFRLSFLAPEITKAIVQGRQPSEFSAIKLMRAGQFPQSWPDQIREFRFR